ncbi:hypothetical protein GCM10022276_07560 [Sphingomonas limnosediminicola]|uniref:Lipoprotein n=2 Tax=Sphingomonas limnosediminicola TaxID=940133 RepID=A0ABP7KY07_9SPHN
MAFQEAAGYAGSLFFLAKVPESLMRRLIIVAAVATLALGACKKNAQSDNNMTVDENLTADSIVSNDITAIDAVTGDAANMAADVNYTVEADNETDNLSEGNVTKPSAVSKPRPKPSKTKTEAPAGNTAAASNATE